MGTLMDYAELAVQFGYITLFVVAFPLAPFLALANNYVEFRSDAFKLLTQMQVRLSSTEFYVSSGRISKCENAIS